MNYKVRHLTTYTYTAPVLVAHHMAHLAPRALPWQVCRRSSLRIRPQPMEIEKTELTISAIRSPLFTLHDQHRRLAVELISRVDLKPRSHPDPEDTPWWESVVDVLDNIRTPELLEAKEFCFDSPLVPTSEALAAYALPSFPANRPIMAGRLDLMHRIHQDFTYDPEATTVATPLERVLADRRGVCQDFAHLGIACLRSLASVGPLCFGLSVDPPAAGQEQAEGQRRLACLAVRLRARHRLGRFRSDQRPRPQPRTCHHGLGPRL